MKTARKMRKFETKSLKNKGLHLIFVSENGFFVSLSSFFPCITNNRKVNKMNGLIELIAILTIFVFVKNTLGGMYR